MTFCPKTAEEWWALVETHWDDLETIIFTYMDCNTPANDPPGDVSGKITGRNIGEEIKYLRKIKDGHKLARYFNGAWGLAPDQPGIHRIPGWHALCDLCSEEYVLDENEAPANNIK
jgi:hypothetical protein